VWQLLLGSTFGNLAGLELPPGMSPPLVMTIPSLALLFVEVSQPERVTRTS